MYTALEVCKYCEEGGKPEQSKGEGSAGLKFPGGGQERPHLVTEMRKQTFNNLEEVRELMMVLLT